MSRSREQRREIEAMLRASGVCWEIVQGGKHLKVLVEGRLVQTITTTGRSTQCRSDRNALAAVRRAIRAAQGERPAEERLP